MSDLIQQLLQVSAKLFQHLTTIPSGEERDAFVESITVLLDERGKAVNALREAEFRYDDTDSSHKMLFDLDKGINERLIKVMDAVKGDMKELNKQKKNEIQYMNPYADVQVMDGMYYDKKK
jgi:flagellar protein FliT